MKRLLVIGLVIGMMTQLSYSQCPTVNASVLNVSCAGGTDGAVNLIIPGDTASLSNPGLLISELRTDPPLGDSNYEWVELVATGFIDFNIRPFTVIFSNNGNATSKGWVEGQIPTPPPRNSTYAFLINSGSVAPGDVFYVGGSSMEPSGIKLRVKATAVEGGDGNIGGAFNGSSGVLGNGGGVADGVAVFNLHVSQIDSNTVPVDAIFFGTSIGNAALVDSTKGFRLPFNDRYNGTRLTSSSFLAPEVLSFYSLQATGTYNRSTGVYVAPRTWVTNSSSWSGSVSAINVTGNQYLWSNGSSSRSISGLQAGNYTVTVTSLGGCAVVQTFSVLQPSALALNLNSMATSCPASDDGSINSVASGGNAPYNYLWSTGATTSTISQRPTGTYTLTITDSKGCSLSSSAIINAGNTFPQLSINPSGVICYGTSTGNITSIVNGGTAPYSYLWSTGSTANSVNLLSAGSYSLVVTDGVGCTDTSMVSVLEYPPIIIDTIVPATNSSGYPINLLGSGLSNITNVRFGDVNASSFFNLSDSSVHAIVPLGAQSGSISVVNDKGCTSTSNSLFSYVALHPELTIRLFIEGLYYNGGFMDLPLVNSGLSGNSIISDSIELFLVDSNDLNSIVFRRRSILFSQGQSTIELPGWVLGNSYYLFIRHRSSVETWSKNPIQFSNENTYYNFSGDGLFPSGISVNIGDRTNFTAAFSANVGSDGGSLITTRGVCWSTATKPTVEFSSKTSNGSGVGLFSGTIPGLIAGTKYYARAYATNAVGTAYSPEVVFTTTNFPIDIDGNIYDTVKIGNQVWMSENLRVSKYRTGAPIPTNLSNTAWTNAGYGAYSIFANSPTNDSIYGKLYNWFAVADPRGLCPSGWHVPTEEEWQTLELDLGMPASELNNGGVRGGNQNIGGQLKDSALVGAGGFWNYPNSGGNNGSGFSALPGGYRDNDALYYKIGNNGIWWSSTLIPNGPFSYYRELNNSYNGVYRDVGGNEHGFSVRCIMDKIPAVSTYSAQNANLNSVIINAEVFGPDSVTLKGICWSVSPGPTADLPTKTVAGSGSGSFSSAISGLLPGTTYYARAYATNGIGIGYGQEVVFSTQVLGPGQVSDTSGNIYDTVAIGSQVWMKQNLSTSRYRNGDSIPYLSNNSVWSSTNQGACSNYGNNFINDSLYGKLYNFNAVVDPRGLCPNRWHVPTENDWNKLESFLGMPVVELSLFGSRGAGQNVGGQLKATGALGSGGQWSAPNVGATNSSGFAGLPGGLRAISGGFSWINSKGFWWTSSSFSEDYKLMRLLDYSDNSIYRYSYYDSAGFSVRCLHNSIPVVTTDSAYGFLPSSASCSGNASDAGGDSVSVRGFCWNTSPGPTVALSTKSTNGAGTGAFTANLTGLQPITTYYVRAYATNAEGTAYGQELTFTTTNLAVDINGYSYDTVVIGSQVWMAENLRVDKYSNGDSIYTGLSDATWQSATTGACAVYGNSLLNDSLYGKLYNWYAVVDPRGLCPTGWHVPSDVEWQTLESTLGMPASELNLTGGRGSVQNVGGQLKKTGIVSSGGLWNSPNTGATNSSGFAALPGGYRISTGAYSSIGNLVYFWTSQEQSSGLAYDRGLGNTTATSNRSYLNKRSGFAVRCTRDVPPTVTTNTVSGVLSISATSGGIVSSSGGDSVTSRGVVWNTQPNPVVSLSSKTVNGSGTGSFTSAISGLLPNTTYYLRAYAVNSAGVGYGNEIVFTTLQSGHFFDIDGNIYDTVAIGSQVWMKQNLRVFRYRNGDSIPTGLSNSAWQNTTSGAYSIYNNLSANDISRGKLYNWYAVADSRGLCPTGWHAPSDSEWKTLEIGQGMPLSIVDNIGDRGGAQNIGGKLKNTGVWTSPNTGATNGSGFTALPGGFRYDVGTYINLNSGGLWWSSTLDSTNLGYYRGLYYSDAEVSRYALDPNYGISVRCIKDQ